MESLKISNLQKPSNKKWKSVADFFLYSLPLYLTAIIAAPIPENTKLWATFGISIITVTLKGFSKFTSNE
jgi:predicted phosphoadenosine phosphosulfate sulfurtransferase